jgi:hypothetical protein
MCSCVLSLFYLNILIHSVIYLVKLMNIYSVHPDLGVLTNEPGSSARLHGNLFILLDLMLGCVGEGCKLIKVFYLNYIFI